MRRLTTMASAPKPAPRPEPKPAPKPQPHPDDDDASAKGARAHRKTAADFQAKPGEQPPPLPIQPSMPTIADEQRERSAEIEEMGVEDWKAERDERSEEDKKGRVVPGVGTHGDAKTLEAGSRR
jgi:hypothetical protein